MTNAKIRPTVLVVFGATGDLMKRKITPALMHLFEKKKLPDRFKVIGFSRGDLSRESFRAQVAMILEGHRDIRADRGKLREFGEKFDYLKGFYQKIEDYRKLADRLNQLDNRWQTKAIRLFYLAVPPNLYRMILTRLPASGLTRAEPGQGGTTRVLVEKPFGKNFKTAIGLDELLGTLLNEEQIYRIDHYLAKEMLQNILSFRFSNTLFEQSWNNQFVESIEIRVLESLGVEERGSFYDGLGALRDMGQNHLLQILSLITMDHPGSLTAEAIRLKRARVLKTLRGLSKAEIKRQTFRAQYRGYREIAGVKPDSKTETYFKMMAMLDSPRWQGVPILLESGKRMGQDRKEVVVSFKHPSPCLCPANLKVHYNNKVIFRLAPREGITIQFWSKQPGLDFKIGEERLKFRMRPKGTVQTQYVEEYERLLLDCIVGEQTLFVSTTEVKTMWQYVDPIVKAWKEGWVPLARYWPESNQARVDSVYLNKSLERAGVKDQGRGEIGVGRETREVGLVGLKKMGARVARSLMAKGWKVVGYDPSGSLTVAMEEEGMQGAYAAAELVGQLQPPRVIWLMASNESVDDLLLGKWGLAQYLAKGDVVVDASEAVVGETIERARRLRRLGIKFADVGVSGGWEGSNDGWCLMVGGKRRLYHQLLPMYLALAAPQGVQFFAGVGAGHLVKSVLTGVALGMTRAIAAGFSRLKQSKYQVDVEKVAQLYNHASGVEGRLLGRLEGAYDKFGGELKSVEETSYAGKVATVLRR